MRQPYVDPDILERFNELIAEARQELDYLDKNPGHFRDPVWPTRWATSCLNLLDRLSVSSNRFVKEFENYGRVDGERLTLGLPLGVLQAARDEYQRGFAIDYHLSVTATVFGDLLSQAQYLLQRDYVQASAVLLGAALEEGLRARARADGLETEVRDTLNPLIEKLTKSGILSAFEADRLKGVAKMRNEAAHGGEFTYGSKDVAAALDDVRSVLSRTLGRGR
jgi:hypothetical protein